MESVKQSVFKCTICEADFDTLKQYFQHVKLWETKSHAQCFRCKLFVDDLAKHDGGYGHCKLNHYFSDFRTTMSHNSLLRSCWRYEDQEQERRIQKQQQF